MSDLKHGGPAFPVQCVWWHNGMTLRQYFFATALQGTIAREGLPTNPEYVKDMVEACYAIADAAIREGTNGTP